jgi:ATPase family protein associated with various cellular activities (AAA)
MSQLDHRRHASLELLLAGARLERRCRPDAPAFLAEYSDEFRSRGNWDGEVSAWRDRLWREATGTPDLPLVRLAAAGAGRLGIGILALVALAAEDGRIAALLGTEGFAGIGTLVALWRTEEGEDRPEAVRETIGWLICAGLLTVANPMAPHHAREVAVTDAAWTLLAGGAYAPRAHEALAYDELPRLATVVLPPELITRTAKVLRLLAEEPETVVWLRGPQDNGRRMLALALVAELGLPAVAMRIEGPRADAFDEAALTAFLRDAVLVIESATAPGEPLVLPQPRVAPVRTVVITTANIALDAAGRPICSLDLPLPAEPERLALWRRAAPEASPRLAELAASFRVTSGALLRAASAARQAGALDREGVRLALRDLSDGRLDAVATRIETEGPREFLALTEAAHAELDGLIVRCRHREALSAHAGPVAGAAGVRALLAGPSGAGKTLAARCLARELGKDLWRVDLAAAVSKFIGETEKTLDRAFAAAEERDIVLLLDEGDALMARRTEVGNANDRYANLETNFLLQRIEGFSGILVVTTNAADRIDAAFQRRMDAVVHFSLPDELARYEILLHHLGEHGVGDELLQEVAVRCVLSGGQLRNVALHARLLALDGGGRLGDHELRRAIEREYRKVDGFCPLKPLLSAVS